MADRAVNFKISASVAGQAAVTGMSRAVSGISTAANAAKASWNAMEADMGSLIRQFNPLRAEKEALLETMRRLKVAQAMEIVTDEEYERQLYQLERALAAVGRTQNEVAASTNNLAGRQAAQQLTSQSWNRGLSANRRALQQAGFQVGDFAVQIAGGQNAMLAFVQQGGQMLQFFGVFGAVAAGVLTVVGTIVIIGMKTKGVFSQLGNVAGATGALLGPLVEVFRALGHAMLWLGNLIVNHMDMILIAASLVGGYMAIGWVGSWLMATNVVRAFMFTLITLGPVEAASVIGTSLLTGAMNLLTVAMNLVPLVAMIAAAVLLIKWFLQLAKGAGGFGAALSLLKDVAVEVFARIRIAMGMLSPAAQIVTSAIQIYFADMWNGIMADATAPLQWLQDGLLTLDDFLNGPNKGRGTATPVTFTPVDTKAFVASMGAAQTAITDLRDKLSAPMESVNALMAAFGKGASGAIDIADWFNGMGSSAKEGGAALANMAEDYKRLVLSLNPAILATQQFKDANEKMKAALLTGDMNHIKETFDQVKKVLEDLQKSYEDMAKTISGSMMTEFDKIRKGTESILDGVINMFNTVIDKAIELMMQPVFDGLANMLTGGIFSFLGLGSMPAMPSFAGGGSTGNGSRSGGLDGMGGFLAMMHPKETVTDHTLGGADAGGGGGSAPVTIVVNVNGATGNSELHEITQNAVTSALRVYDQSILPRSINRIVKQPRRNS
jgi:hypothetical protein